MKLVFDRKALSDIDNIYDWIARASSNNAFAVIERILESIDHLSAFPGMGRAGHRPGLFEWPIPGLPYIASYQVQEDIQELVITAIFHQAQDRQLEGD